MIAALVMHVSMNSATLTRSSPNSVAAPGCYCVNGGWRGLAPPAAHRCFTIPTDEACARFGSPCPPSLLDQEPHLRQHLRSRSNGCHEALSGTAAPRRPRCPRGYARSRRVGERGATCLSGTCRRCRPCHEGCRNDEGQPLAPRRPASGRTARSPRYCRRHSPTKNPRRA